jgi:PIN domain nuclease of toxin-antitoxin system
VDLLLDTHAFIWWAARDSRLVENARIAIADADNRVVVSAVSVWEIAIKRASGKLAFHHNILEVLTRTRFDSVDITPRHADLAGSLPLHHADPFDRLLVAQAKIEGFVLVTQDRQLLPYGVPILGVN